MRGFSAILDAEWRRVWSTKRWLWPLVAAAAFAIPFGYIDGIWMENARLAGNAWDFVLYMLVNPFGYGFAGVAAYSLWLGDLFDDDITHHYRWYVLTRLHGDVARYLVARGVMILITAALDVIAISLLWFGWGWHLFGVSTAWSAFAHGHSIYWPVTAAILKKSPLVVTVEAMGWATAGMVAVAAAAAVVSLWTDWPWTVAAFGTAFSALAVWAMPMAVSVRWNILAQGMWIMHPPAFPGAIAPPEQAPAVLPDWWSIGYVGLWIMFCAAAAWARMRGQREW
jgi:hypothetical protein